jgi:hypothetical protein
VLVEELFKRAMWLPFAHHITQTGIGDWQLEIVVNSEKISVGYYQIGSHRRRQSRLLLAFALYFGFDNGLHGKRRSPDLHHRVTR